MSIIKIKDNSKIYRNQSIVDYKSRDFESTTNEKIKKDISFDRSVKEFSYFDSSKNKLRENDFFKKQISSSLILNSDDNNLESDLWNKDSKNLPQVMTIRFN